MNLRRGAATVVAVVASIVAVAVPVAAHSEVDGFSPAPGQEVGGVVDRIEIGFEAPIADGVVLVEAPDGTRVEGVSSLPDDTTLRFDMDPLDQVGQHIVTWRVLAADGDGQEAAYAFTWDPDAAPLDHDDGLPTWGVVLIVALALAVAGLSVRLVVRIRSLRRSDG